MLSDIDRRTPSDCACSYSPAVSCAEAVAARWKCAPCRDAIVYGKPKGRDAVSALIAQYGERAVADAFAKVRRYGP